MTQIDINKDQCGVYTQKNVYDMKPPYNKCEIICPTNQPGSLMECVFKGSLEECQNFVKQNCK